MESCPTGSNRTPPHGLAQWEPFLYALWVETRTGAPMQTAIASAGDGYNTLAAGDPAPWFIQRSASNPRYVFDTAAGRYIVLCFYGSAADPVGKAALDAVFASRQQFDDVRACFFGVSLDPADERSGRVPDSTPGLRFFWDFDGPIS